MIPSLARLDWQATLFAPRPKRLDLAALRDDWPLRPVRVRIHRNTPFDYVAAAWEPFLAYAGYRAEISQGAYDDSLSFADFEDADLHVVWLDHERFRLEGESRSAWLTGRLEALRRLTHAPILVADSPAGGLAIELPGVKVFPVSAVAAEMGDAFRDNRLAGVGATTLSGPAIIQLARELGMRWIPACLEPALKAVAVDLDQTLYAGVLGEDGPEALTPYLDLQRRLVALAEDGVFIALISKNVPEDVDALFARRQDFSLRPHHVAARSIGWSDKAQGLLQVADSLRIAPDAILFLDDNLGELASVASVLPETALVHAADPVRSLAALRWSPGLLRLSADAADAVRLRDLAANAERTNALHRAADVQDYLRELDTRLALAVDDPTAVARVHELSGKTNQFNLGLRRFSEAEVAAWRGRSDGWIVTAHLSDRLSDSGLIAMIMLEKTERGVAVAELCISCRALGRGLEDVIVAAALDRVAPEPGQVTFHYVSGPRNQPARDWLERFAGQVLAKPDGAVDLAWPPARSPLLSAVQIVWKGMP